MAKRKENSRNVDFLFGYLYKRDKSTCVKEFRQSLLCRFVWSAAHLFILSHLLQQTVACFDWITVCAQNTHQRKNIKNIILCVWLAALIDLGLSIIFTRYVFTVYHSFSTYSMRFSITRYIVLIKPAVSPSRAISDWHQSSRLQMMHLMVSHHQQADTKISSSSI